MVRLWCLFVGYSLKRWIGLQNRGTPRGGRGGGRGTPQRSGANTPLGRGGASTPRGRGGASTPRGRGGPSTPRGRGGPNAPSGRGETVTDTPRHGPANRGTPNPARGTAPQGRGIGIGTPPRGGVKTPNNSTANTPYNRNYTNTNNTLSNLLYASRPLLRPVVFVPSVLTKVLFEEEAGDELLKAAVHLDEDGGQFLSFFLIGIGLTLQI